MDATQKHHFRGIPRQWVHICETFYPAAFDVLHHGLWSVHSSPSGNVDKGHESFRWEQSTENP